MKTPVILGSAFLSMAVVALGLKAEAASPPAGSASPTLAANGNRFASLEEAIAEVKRRPDTDENKRYDHEFDEALQPRLADVVHECAKGAKLPIVFDVVFVLAADGHVESTLHTADQSAAACVADRFRDLRLPAPPHAPWPAHLHVELSPPNKDTKPRSGPDPGKSREMQLSMQAAREAANTNFSEALRLYDQAIKLKGPFAPFVYHNRGMFYLNRAKESADRQERMSNLQKAIADFKVSIRLGAASDDELNRGLEKMSTKAKLEEANALLEKQTGQ